MSSTANLVVEKLQEKAEESEFDYFLLSVDNPENSGVTVTTVAHDITRHGPFIDALIRAGLSDPFLGKIILEAGRSLGRYDSSQN